MRSASSYRAAKKKAAREKGVPFAVYNEHYARSRVHAAIELEQQALSATPAAARKALAIWAANGGRATAVSPAISDAELDALNANKPITEEQAIEGAKKLTAADVDKALEATLSTWQKAGNVGPLPLSIVFAARARQLLWVEGVEFIEEKGNGDQG